MPILRDEENVPKLDPNVVRDALVESYPKFAPEINNARRRNLSDSTIRQALETKTDESFQRGVAVDEIARNIGAPPTKLLNSLQPKQLVESELGRQVLEQQLETGGPEALQQPFVDPVFAGAGGFATGGLGGAALSLLTEPVVGQATEQVTESQGPVAGIITSLLTGLGAGALEQQVLKKITGVASPSRLSKIFGFTEDLGQAAPKTRVRPDVDPTDIKLRTGGVEVTPPSVGRAVPKTSIPPTPSATLTDRVLTPESIARVGAARKEFLKLEGGRPLKVDPLPQISDSFARKTLTRYLGEKRGLAPQEAFDLIGNMNELEVKSGLNKLVKTGEPKKKRGGQKKAGVAGQSPDRASRVPTEILETIPAKSTNEISEGLAAEVETAQRLTGGTQSKIETTTPDLKFGDEGASGLTRNLAEIANNLENATDARGGKLIYDTEESVYRLTFDGDVTKFSNLEDVEGEIARRGVVAREPVDKLPLELLGEKKSTFQKVMNEEPLTRGDKKNLAKQKNSLKGTAKKSIEEVDPRLKELESMGFSAKDLKALESGKLTPEAERKLAAEMVGETTDDLTFGSLAGQVAAKLELELRRLRKVKDKIQGSRGKARKSKESQALAQFGLSVGQTRDFSLGLSYAKEVGKDTPEGISSILKSIGMSDDAVEFISTRLLNKEKPSFTIPIVPGLLVDNPKINTLQTLINTQEASLRVEELGIEQFAARLAKDPSLDKRVVQLIKGDRSLKNATPKEKQAIVEWKAFAKDFADRTGLKSDATYLTRLTDFEVLFDVFKKSLQDHSFSSLHPRFKEQLGDSTALDNVKRIFRGNTDWATVQPADRRTLKKVFGFEQAQTWADLPPSIKESIPEEVFTPFLIPRTGKKVPTVQRLSDIIRLYGKSMAKKIHLQPVVDLGKELMSTFEAPEVVSALDGMTDKAFMNRQLARVLGRPEADDKLVSAFIQNINKTMQAQVLSEAGVELGTQMLQSGFLRGVIGPDSAMVNLIMQPINTFMSSGRLGSAYLKMFKRENQRDLSKVNELFGGTVDMIRREASNIPDARLSPLTRKLKEYDETLTKWVLSPLTGSEFIVRGLAIQAEIEAGIARGLDPLEIIKLSAAKASKVVPNLEMSDVLATAALQQAPQQLFVNPTRSGRAPIFTGKAGRLMMTLTSFPVGQGAAIKKGLTRSIMSGDNGRATRYLAVLGFMLTLPYLMDEMGFDVRNFAGINNLHVRVSAPFFKAVINGVEAMSGRTISGREASRDKLIEYMKNVTIPQRRFGKRLVESYDNALRGFAVDKHMNNLYDTTPLAEMFRAIGVPPSKAYNMREARFKIGQQISEYNLAKEKALEALIKGDQAGVDEFKRDWRAEIESAQSNGNPIFTQKMIENKLKGTTQRSVERVPRANQTNPEILEELKRMKEAGEPSFIDKISNFLLPEAGAAEPPKRYTEEQILKGINKHSAELKNKGVVPNKLLAKQIQVESKGDPKAFNNKSKASGLAQFVPKTWREWAPKSGLPKGTKPTDPNASLVVQRKYMNWLAQRFNGNLEKAFAAYNHGLGNVRKTIRIHGQRRWREHLPLETRNYLLKLGF